VKLSPSLLIVLYYTSFLKLYFNLFSVHFCRKRLFWHHYLDEKLTHDVIKPTYSSMRVLKWTTIAPSWKLTFIKFRG
jgi:hypothetical protein